MKTLLKILSVGLIMFFSGCYTVLWNPGEPLPSEDTYYNSYYYEPNFWGDYYYYYGTPWWWSLDPLPSEPYQRGSDINTLRDNNGGRPSGKGRDIIKTDPPAIADPGSSNQGSTPKTNAGNNSSTRSSSGSRDNSTIRNNDGSRSSETRRR